LECRCSATTECFEQTHPSQLNILFSGPEAFGIEPVEAADRSDALERASELHPGCLMAALEAERVPDHLRQYVLASWLKTL